MRRQWCETSPGRWDAVTDGGIQMTVTRLANGQYGMQVTDPDSRGRWREDPFASLPYAQREAESQAALTEAAKLSQAESLAQLSAAAELIVRRSA